MNFKSLGIKPYIASRFSSLSAKEQYRQSILWSAVILSVLVLGFTILHVQAVPRKISHSIERALDKRPWLHDYVVVDGRRIYLTGEVEPDSGLENEIQSIREIPGVADVINRLSEIPRPSPFLKIDKNGDEIVLTGELDGEILERTVDLVTAAFPAQKIDDRIRVDDRVGRPLWIEGFGPGLKKLADVEVFELNGWRDRIELTGTAATDLRRRQLGYALPASLIPRVKVTNRLRRAVSGGFPPLTLISDWQGTYIGGSVPSPDARDRLTAAVKETFGENEFQSDLAVDGNLRGEEQLERLSELIVYLDEVRDLRLQSAETGFVVRGRVDRPKQLGKFLYARSRLNLDKLIRSEIAVSSGDRSASVSLFSDRRRAIVNGVLPSVKVRKQLIDEIENILGVSRITDLISVQPDIAHSRWISKWPKLLALMPAQTMGVTVDDTAMLITGSVENEQESANLDQRLSILFPQTNTLNWVTVKE